jgi:hypothetical protein
VPLTGLFFPHFAPKHPLWISSASVSQHPRGDISKVRTRKAHKAPQSPLQCCRAPLLASHQLSVASHSSFQFAHFLTLPGSTLSNALTTLRTREVTASLSR